MISEGSCDTEDRSNDCWKKIAITEINYILKYIKIENNTIVINISEYCCIFHYIE